MDESQSSATAEPGQACYLKALCMRGLLLRAEGKPAEKVPERRLWLTGSMESSPGVCGLYRTARTEPMGDRLRLLYKGDPRLSSAWGKPQDQQGAPPCACCISAPQQRAYERETILDPPVPLYAPVHLLPHHSASTVMWPIRRDASQ